MKVLGVGLGRTGTSSLHKALQILNFKSIHYDQVRLRDILDGSNNQPDFKRYDDVDAVTDVPTAYFYREILAAYPECKAILTVRDVDSWWESSVRHDARDPVVICPSLKQRLHAWLNPTARMHLDRHNFRSQLRNYIYGAATPREFLYKRKFVEYSERAQREIPAERLLVMNIVGGDGWDVLCPFLGVPVPALPFPHEFRLK